MQIVKRYFLLLGFCFFWIPAVNAAGIRFCPGVAQISGYVGLTPRGYLLGLGYSRYFVDSWGLGVVAGLHRDVMQQRVAYQSLAAGLQGMYYLTELVNERLYLGIVGELSGEYRTHHVKLYEKTTAHWNGCLGLGPKLEYFFLDKVRMTLYVQPCFYFKECSYGRYTSRLQLGVSIGI